MLLGCLYSFWLKKLCAPGLIHKTGSSIQVATAVASPDDTSLRAAAAAPDQGFGEKADNVHDDVVSAKNAEVESTIDVVRGTVTLVVDRRSMFIDLLAQVEMIMYGSGPATDCSDAGVGVSAGGDRSRIVKLNRLGTLNTDGDRYYIGDELVPGAVQLDDADAGGVAARDAVEAAAGGDEALALFIRANQLTEQGDVQGAVKLFKQAERLDPNIANRATDAAEESARNVDAATEAFTSANTEGSLMRAGITHGMQLIVWDGETVDGVQVPSGEANRPQVLHVEGYAGGGVDEEHMCDVVLPPLYHVHDLCIAAAELLNTGVHTARAPIGSRSAEMPAADISMLCEMGFNPAIALDQLRKANGDVQTALDVLLGLDPAELAMELAMLTAADDVDSLVTLDDSFDCSSGGGDSGGSGGGGQRAPAPPTSGVFGDAANLVVWKSLKNETVYDQNAVLREVTNSKGEAKMSILTKAAATAQHMHNLARAENSNTPSTLKLMVTFPTATEFTAGTDRIGTNTGTSTSVATVVEFDPEDSTCNIWKLKIWLLQRMESSNKPPSGDVRLRLYKGASRSFEGSMLLADNTMLSETAVQTNSHLALEIGEPIPHGGFALKVQFVPPTTTHTVSRLTGELVGETSQETAQRAKASFISDLTANRGALLPVIVEIITAVRCHRIPPTPIGFYNHVICHVNNIPLISHFVLSIHVTFDGVTILKASTTVRHCVEMAIAKLQLPLGDYHLRTSVWGSESKGCALDDLDANLDAANIHSNETLLLEKGDIVPRGCGLPFGSVGGHTF
jgi:hypothetical protein